MKKFRALLNFPYYRHAFAKDKIYPVDGKPITDSILKQLIAMRLATEHFDTLGATSKPKTKVDPTPGTTAPAAKQPPSGDHVVGAMMQKEESKETKDAPGTVKAMGADSSSKKSGK